jgi:hypothetical protein
MSRQARLPGELDSQEDMMGGILVDSSSGNFDVLVPRVGGGADHFVRANDEPDLPWYGPHTAFGSRDDVTDIALLEKAGGDLVAVRSEGGRLKWIERSKDVYHGRRIDRWWPARDLPAADDVGPGPGLSQDRQLHVVAPYSAGGLGHWWRDPSAGAWSSEAFASGRRFHAATPIHRDVSGIGTRFEVVAWLPDTGLIHFHRDPVDATWYELGVVPGSSGVGGFPAMTQAFDGSLQLVAPVVSGGFRHWWAENGPTPTWHEGEHVGTGPIRRLGLSRSSFGEGNLEFVADFDGALAHAYATPRPVVATDRWDWSPLTHFWHRGSPLRDPQTWGLADVVANLAWRTTPPSTVPVGTHMVLLRTRHVLIFGIGEEVNGTNFGMLTFNAAFDRVQWQWGAPPDPSSPDPEHPDPPRVFCAGHAALPDGRVLIVGGHVGHVKSVHLFDPGSYDPPARPPQICQLDDMQPEGRWYPTVTCLEDGRMLIISGDKYGPDGPVDDSTVNATMQIFDPVTKQLGQAIDDRTLSGGFHTTCAGDFYAVNLYPFVYQLPSGRVLVHSRNATRFLNMATHPPQWDPYVAAAVRCESRTYPAQGTSVLLPLRAAEQYRARVLTIGGGGLDREAYKDAEATVHEPATNTVELLDAGSIASTPDAPVWVEQEPMKHERVLCDSVLLPDGTVLVVGGSATGRSDAGIAPVLPTELYDPQTGRWKELASISVPRMYHSSALLVPDGRVMMAGKDGRYQLDPYKYDEYRVEMFSPPYLFRGSRPVITRLWPRAAAYGEVMSIEFSGACPPPTRVTLVRAASVTHGFNMDQRLIEPPIRVTGSNVEVTMPPNGRVAPPGYYMVFLLSAAGVPSTASMLRIGG